MILNHSEYSWMLRSITVGMDLLRSVTVCYELEWNRTCSKPIFIITFSNEVGNWNFSNSKLDPKWFWSVIKIASLHDDISIWFSFRHQSCHHFMSSMNIILDSNSILILKVPVCWIELIFNRLKWCDRNMIGTVTTTLDLYKTRLFNTAFLSPKIPLPAFEWCKISFCHQNSVTNTGFSGKSCPVSSSVKMLSEVCLFGQTRTR